MPTNTTTLGYLDCPAGISGDMFLAALLDAGLDEEVLRTELARLPIGNYRLQVTRTAQTSIMATRLSVATEEQPPRSWHSIRTLIEKSSLAAAVKEKSLAVFALLAETEAGIHGCPVEDVHFHELGGIDAIVDIVGTVIGLEELAIDRLITSPLPLGRGLVKCAHGLLPLPAPAVCEILKGVPVYGVALEDELVTPTGAALIKALSASFGQFPVMTIFKVGYGTGSHTLEDGRPNLCRLVLGTARGTTEAQEVEVVETNLDDWSPETFPYLSEQLFKAGAADVSLVPIQMKKGRPGFLLRVIVAPDQAWEIKRCILSETTAIGLRFRTEQRLTLPRERAIINTPWGPLTVKRVDTPRGTVLYPEYESCCQMAREKRLNLQEVYAEVGRHQAAATTGEEAQ